ncbi:MAG: glycosyltransferase family 2 protein [Muribaculaceae bacterium]|nr:glycosyltransferase family 2 protein [Muribaculaceae bacterium]
MITASIVVHKSPEKQLSTALESLEKSSVDKIYVIDNSPEDQLRDISEKYSKVQYLKVDNNGFGAGHNIAIKEALRNNTSFHLIMNADVWWEGDIIKPIYDFMKENPEVGMVSPKTFYPNGELQYTCRMLPSPVDMFLRGFLPDKLKGKRNKKYLLEDFDHNHSLNCPYLLGSFMFFRTEALREVGLFDERFFMYPEDIDITRRIHEKWETIYWPKVSIIHEHQQASKKSIKMFWIHFTNMVKYFNKWGWFYDAKRKKYNKQLIGSI